MVRHGTDTDAYIRITLTDEDDIPDAFHKLRVIYPNLMELKYDNLRTRSTTTVGGAEDVERKSPLELFSEFYEKQNGQPLSAEQRQFSQEWIEKIWEERA